jgi:hypothetical protein
MTIPVEKTELLAHVWSFTNRDNDGIPYSIEVVPGKTPRKTCSCWAFRKSGGKTCKHIAVMRIKINNGTILQDDHFKLTEFGMVYLRVNEKIARAQALKHASNCLCPRRC